MMLMFLSLSWNCPCNATRQFFYVQCMQSRLPNIPRNPRFSLIAIYFSISCRVGSLK
ncbi:hypothetical protein M758_UG303300 [Ceratodon purpureus]|nr:hypothetical protein M758_UG303300 [Ceratodon purpureus]